MIREAVPGDAAEIAGFIILAMNDLAAKFVGSSVPEKAISLFERFAALPDNQYSYENILVYEDEDGLCGMISAYDGANLEILRAPFLDHLEKVYGFNHNPENETQPGEYYIDCISVSPRKQGKGIGSALINAMVDYAFSRGQHTLGLLVDKENPKAGNLYSSLGFKTIEEVDFMGARYFHMQMTR